MVAPFEGLFGDTSELRTIQFLLPVSGLRFNISELARETRISRQTMMRVVAKLTKWNVLKIAGRHGGANYYALNQDSGFIKAFEDLDNLIIEQMQGEESKIKMATTSQEQCPVVSSLWPEGHDLSVASQIPQ
jgi:DNA-binding IscR family transcriptional regulator